MPEFRPYVWEHRPLTYVMAQSVAFFAAPTWIAPTASLAYRALIDQNRHSVDRARRSILEPIAFLKMPANEDAVFAKGSEALRGRLQDYFRARSAPEIEIEDLVQEVFLRIVRRGNPDDIDDLVPYAFVTAASVLRDRHRRRSVRSADAHIVFDPDMHGDEDIEPERALLGKQALQATTRALLELPERTRQVFILRRIEGESYAEIASRIGISVSAAEKHMLRAVRHMLTRQEEIL